MTKNANPMQAETVRTRDSVLFRTLAALTIGVVLVAVIVLGAAWVYLDSHSKDRADHAGEGLMTTLIRNTHESINKGQRESFQRAIDDFAELDGVTDVALFARFKQMVYRAGEVSVGLPFVQQDGVLTENINEPLYRESNGRYQRPDWTTRDAIDTPSAQKHIQEYEGSGQACADCHFQMDESLQFDPETRRASLAHDGYKDFYYAFPVDAECVVCHTHWQAGEDGGYLQIRLDMAPFLGQRNETLEGMGIAVIAALIPTLIILVLILRGLVFKPLARLRATFGKIGAGDYGNEIKVGRPDEIGLLFSSLDAMQTNLSERTEAERRAAREVARVKSALDKASTNIMLADTSDTVIYVNDAFAKLMRDHEAALRRDLPQLSATSLVGSAFTTLQPGGLSEPLQLSKITRTTSRQMKIGGRSFSLVANPVSDEQGDRLGTVVEWTDRTTEVAAEEELDALLNAVTRGDFSQRLSLDGKTGFFRDIAEGMNHLTGIVAKVLDDLATVLRALAQGDLTRQMDADYEGRFAELRDDTNATVDQLRVLVGQIQEAAGEINSAAGEIAAGNADLSERTEEQASSLEETASSMEELNATVKQTADNARSANALAQRANQEAQNGGEVIQRVVQTMSAIQTSSKSIADIIGVIDSIAFQTNILALNAAVEAARAGEQGRGFAVVASEVRNLAQRSAQAAKEIKELISESVATVDDGATLVEEAGGAMQTIVDSFQQVVTLISEIDAVSREQSSGIEQVTQAVAQMDDMTQRNAALVEEASAAAESLAEQAASLSENVSLFKLSQDLVPAPQQQLVSGG